MILVPPFPIHYFLPKTYSSYEYESLSSHQQVSDPSLPSFLNSKICIEKSFPHFIQSQNDGCNLNGQLLWRTVYVAFIVRSKLRNEGEGEKEKSP